MTFIGLLAYGLAGGRWAGLFAASAAAAALLHGRRHDVALQPRKRVNLARAHGPSWVETCSYCRKPADAWDHVLPFSRGGSDERWNMAPACKRCNSTKGDRTPEEWWKDLAGNDPMPAFWPRSERA